MPVVRQGDKPVALTGSNSPKEKKRNLLQLYNASYALTDIETDFHEKRCICLTACCFALRILLTPFLLLSLIPHSADIIGLASIVSFLIISSYCLWI